VSSWLIQINELLPFIINDIVYAETETASQQTQQSQKIKKLEKCYLQNIRIGLRGRKAAHGGGRLVVKIATISQIK